MKVKELIEKLKKFDSELDVLVFNDCHEIEDVYQNKSDIKDRRERIYIHTRVSYYG